MGFGPGDEIFQTSEGSCYLFEVVADLDSETFDVLVDGAPQVVDRDLDCSYVDGLTVTVIDGEGWVDDVCVNVPASPVFNVSWARVKGLYRP